jgi:hypothetical protein
MRGNRANKEVFCDEMQWCTTIAGNKFSNMLLKRVM